MNYFIRKSFWSVIISSILVSGVAFAAEKADTGDDLDLESLLNIQVTTATKTPIKLSDVPAATTVITRQDIERYGYRTLAEALARVPEVYVHFDGNNYSSDFRGFFQNNNQRRILFLLNGHRLNERFHFGDFYADVIGDLSNVEQIEIIRGPGAALYGSVAVLGVVNIKTRDAGKMTGKTTAIETAVTADETASAYKVSANVRHVVNDKINFTADAYWFTGNTSYDSKVNSTKPWTSNFTKTPGVANYKISPDFYLALPKYSFAGGPDLFNGGAQIPNFNFNVNAYDFSLGFINQTRDVSWIQPKDTNSFNAEGNNRTWGAQAVYLDWNPKGEMEKYEFQTRLSYNFGSNSEVSEFSAADAFDATTSLAVKRLSGQFGNANKTLDDNGTTYTVYNTLVSSAAKSLDALNAHGGGTRFNYVGLTKSLGLQTQIAPYKSKYLHWSLGGNYENADYLNIQWFDYKDRSFIGWAPGGGIGDKGYYYGAWTQALIYPISNVMITAGVRYDYQNISDAFRNIGGKIAYSGAAGAETAIRAQNRAATDITPRIALNYRFNNDSNIRLIYGQAFRAVPPQEVIRLADRTVDAKSEKSSTYEAIYSQNITAATNATLNLFYLDNNILYLWNPDTASFGIGSGWKNMGGALNFTFATKEGIEVWANATYYNLQRPMDAYSGILTKATAALPSVKGVYKALDSASLMFKGGLSYRYQPTLTTAGLEGYFNGPIDVATPFQNNAADAAATASSDPFKIYTVPSSFLANLTLTQDFAKFGFKGLTLLLKVRNLLGTTVNSPLNSDQQSWSNSVYYKPNQLPDFGRQFMLTVKYSI